MDVPQSFRLRWLRQSRRNDFRHTRVPPSFTGLNGTGPAVDTACSVSSAISTGSSARARRGLGFGHPRHGLLLSRKTVSGLRTQALGFCRRRPVGNLHNGDSLKFTLKPGKHRIYSTDKSTGIDLAVKPGETYYVRVDILVGFWKGHGGVTLVDPQQGKYELGQVSH